MLFRRVVKGLVAGGAIALASLVVLSAGNVRAQEAEAPAASVVAEVVPEAEIQRFEATGAEWSARASEFAQVRENVSDMLAAIDAEIVALGREADREIDVNRSLEELETERLGVEQDLLLARRELVALEVEASGRAQRRKQLPELLAAAKQRLVVLEGEAAPVAGAPGRSDKRLRLREVKRDAIRAEIDAYEEELRSYDARGQLLAKGRERDGLRVELLENRGNALLEVVSAMRQGEAEVAAEEAGRLLESAAAMPSAVLEMVQGIAEQNREFALQRTGENGLLQEIEETRRKRVRAEEQAAAVTAELDFLRRTVETGGGASGSVGVVLRKARSEAPDVGKYRRFIRMRQKAIGATQLRQIELAERRRAVSDVDAIVAERMSDFESVLAPEDYATVASLLRNLLETQRRTLDALIEDTESLFQQLVDFDASQRDLVARTDALLQFVDERILWIPSGKPLPPAPTSDAWEALGWLFSPRFWGQVQRAATTSIVTAPLVAAVVIVLLLSAPLALPRLRAQVAKRGEQAVDPACLRFQPTGEAVCLTFLLAAWGPGLLAFIGWRLGVSVDATLFVRSVAHGLVVASLLWFSLLLPRQLLRRRGIAEAHLGWPEEPVRALRRHLGWLALVGFLTAFVMAAFETRGDEAWNEAVGRGAFLVLLGTAVSFSQLVLRERKGAVRRLAEARSPTVPSPLAWRVLHVAAVVGGLALAAAVVRGYYWTALQLAVSLHATLVFLLLLVFAQQLGARWFLLASRRLAIKRWREAEIAREEKPAEASEGDAPKTEEAEVALATVDEHTHRILRNATLFAALIGVWMIWADLIPAAGALRAVELWGTSVTETVETTNAAGEIVASIEQRLVPVTLADLLLALVIAAATLALVRNLPGLLEVSLFRQLGTSAGERYAYATISTYAVSVAGAAAALYTVGIGWSSIQWLVAAVGLGLGFGLQEIFANFISGLIILFERPIRVGDTVTVGDISGTVSKVRIRATWITGFDRKELVVPNKEFITSRLVNWSLSDAVLRVEIPVGVAYGSDTDKAVRVLREVAERNEQVLDDPAPYAIFRGFGASSLDLELRAFSPDVKHYLQIVHELHMEIDRAFRAEGIEIAFPQRDLHLRSIPVSREVPDADPGACGK